MFDVLVDLEALRQQQCAAAGVPFISLATLVLPKAPILDAPLPPDLQALLDALDEPIASLKAADPELFQVLKRELENKLAAE